MHLRDGGDGDQLHPAFLPAAGAKAADQRPAIVEPIDAKLTASLRLGSRYSSQQSNNGCRVRKRASCRNTRLRVLPSTSSIGGIMPGVGLPFASTKARARSQRTEARSKRSGDILLDVTVTPVVEVRDFRRVRWERAAACGGPFDGTGILAKLPTSISAYPAAGGWRPTRQTRARHTLRACPSHRLKNPSRCHSSTS